jgi:hypothetical protein
MDFWSFRAKNLNRDATLSVNKTRYPIPVQAIHGIPCGCVCLPPHPRPGLPGLLVDNLLRPLDAVNGHPPQAIANQC